MKVTRDKITYESTGEVTGEITVNGQKVRANYFKFEHSVEGIPTATISFVDPDVNITTLDCLLIKKKGVMVDE